MIALSLAFLAIGMAGKVAEPRGPSAAIPSQESAVSPRSPTPNPTVATPLPPQDWRDLPVLRFRRAIPATTESMQFVAGEVAAGRCPGAVRTSNGWQLTIDLALFATADGHIRRITPRAISCPTVEQYAAGLLLGTARDNIDLRGADTDIWYRTTMTFGWKA